MGAMNMTYQQARAVPKQMLWALWEAHERRLSRNSYRMLEDITNAAGVQGEMEWKGQKPPAPKSWQEPVGFQKHMRRRLDEGWPVSKKKLSISEQQKQIDDFFGDDLIELDEDGTADAGTDEAPKPPVVNEGEQPDG